MPSKRPLQVADRIKEIIANALESRVKDPRLGFVTITDVRVTGDLQQASIFYTVLGDTAAHEATAAALTSASIEFFLDGMEDSASAMNDLIEQMHKADAELAKLRATAKPVAEDPYKKHN